MSMQNNQVNKHLAYDDESSAMSSPSRSFDDDNLLDKIIKYNQSTSQNQNRSGVGDYASATSY